MADKIGYAIRLLSQQSALFSLWERDGTMATYLAFHEVDDVDHWLSSPKREEVFGPVAAVIPFADEAEAVSLANDTPYGLSGSIWTRDGQRALRVVRALETGVISVNSNSSVRVSTPFGGFKQSGVGRELGPDALEHYTELKNVYYATAEGP